MADGINSAFKGLIRSKNSK